MSAKIKYERVWFAPRFGNDETPPESSTNPNPPKQDGTDYKVLYEKTKADLEKAQADATKAYTGLQKTLSAEQLAKKQVEESLTALNAQFQEVASVRTTLDTQLQTVQSTLSQKDEELKNLRISKTRLSIIVKEFPALAEFESDGLIPTPTDAIDAEGKVDEAKLRNIFSTFQAKVMAIAESKRTNFNAGGSPPSPQPNQSPTAQAFLAEANAAALKGDMATYNERFSKYQEALNKQ